MPRQRAIYFRTRRVPSGYSPSALARSFCDGSFITNRTGDEKLRYEIGRQDCEGDRRAVADWTAKAIECEHPVRR